MRWLPKVVGVVLVGETTALLVFGWLLIPRLMERTSNVLPGQADYPVSNSQASQTLTLDLLIPSSLHLGFHAVYTATFGREDTPKPTRCHYITKEGTETEYSVSQTAFSVELPLTLVFVGNEPDREGRSPTVKRFRAAVPVDRFQPGRCLWAMDRITYRPQGAWVDSDLARVGRSMGRSDALDMIIGLWCTSVPASREMPAHQACLGPTPSGPPRERMDILFPREPEQTAAFPADTERVEFDFNDVDNMNPMWMTFPASK